MNENLFAPKPEEVAPTLQSPNEEALPFAQTLKSDVMPNDGRDIPTLINEEETFSQSGTLRSAEEYEAAAGSGIREKTPESVSVMGTAPISSEVISEESYPMEEVLDPKESTPEGFKLHDIPEWEVKAKGTIPTSEHGDAPNQPSAFDETENGTLRAA